MSKWGTAASGVSSLWGQANAAAGLAVDGTLAAATGRLDAELGYGPTALNGRGLMMACARVARSKGGDQAWPLGARQSLVWRSNLSLEASRRAREGETAA